MQEDKIPKVFISYSWSSEELVIQLSQRLRSHGVDVILDKWDLKEGQDKYVFMEQCVNNPEVSRVLIICDKTYMDKANNRIGGVGDETVIISSEIYGKVEQEKFIPIIAECDTNGNPYVPIYIKSRIYINLSDESRYEEEYEKLLRNIYEQPLYKKPALGKKPEWLENEDTNFFVLEDLLRQIKGSIGVKKQETLIRRFILQYIELMKEYYKVEGMGPEEVFSTFLKTKTNRDYFLEFLDVLVLTECDYADIVASAFEEMYNTLTNVNTYGAKSYSEGDLEVFFIHIWELFICSIAFFRYNKDYKTISKILKRTYFVKESIYNEHTVPVNYAIFRHHSRMIEEYYKPTTEHKNKFTLLGDVICNQRQKLPIYSKENIAQSDLFLCQIFNALDFNENDYSYRCRCWFPNFYIYASDGGAEWRKMKSKLFCQKMYELFEVNSIDELKKVLAKCKYDSRMGYNNAFDSAPAILNYIKVEEVGILP